MVNKALASGVTAVLLSSFISGCSLFSKSPEEKRAAVKELVKAPDRSELDLLESSKNAYDRGLFRIAADTWADLRDGYPSSYYTNLAELKVADSYFFSRQFPEALAAYEEFARSHPGHEATPYVRFQIADCHFQQYQGVKRDHSVLNLAVERFTKLIQDSPNSEWAARARGRVQEATEALAENELEIARFYLRQEKYPSALNRYHALATRYPDTAVAKESLASLREEFLATGKFADRDFAPRPPAPVTISTTN